MEAVVALIARVEALEKAVRALLEVIGKPTIIADAHCGVSVSEFGNVDAWSRLSETPWDRAYACVSVRHRTRST